VGLSGCGSGDTGQAAGSDPKAWVGVFCNGIGDVAAGTTILQDQQPTPQAQKDMLLRFIDHTQQSMSAAAGRLRQLGPPAIVSGRQVQDTAVSFFATGAHTVDGPRAQLSALDPNAPDFYDKMNAVPAPDLQSVGAQAQALLRNRDLEPYRLASPECKRTSAAGRQSH
jgi:hypothetical protein